MIPLFCPLCLQSAYCGAKHAINGFTSAVRIELMHNKSNVKISVAQLPAVNTPQFVWGRNKMPCKAQPVPPIYAPEVIAEAVYWLAHHDRRELWIGGSTVKAILAENRPRVRRVVLEQDRVQDPDARRAARS